MNAKPLCQNVPAPADQAEVTGATTLKSIDLVDGTGDTATTGKTVTMHYYGRLADGRKFDSSCDRNQPFSFTLGGGQVIQGFDQGVNGMKVGGQRRLIIPASLAYGARGAGPIPPNSNIVFDLELLKVE